MDEPLLTVAEVATQLRIDPETVRRWLRTGKLAGVRVGGARAGWRIPASALARFVPPYTPRA
jgi:excisionase family DNA binding protein